MFGFHRLSDPSKMASMGIADDHQRVIVKDDSSDSVSDVHDVPRAARSEPVSAREQLKELMETQNFHIAIVVLVVFDCLLVITELVLDFQVLNEASKCNGTENTGKEATEVTAATVIHYMSLSILSVFMVELGVKIPVFGMAFWRSKLEVFDAIIIVASFVLDIVSLIFEEEFAALQLVVLLRLWRIVRVVNGVILSVETQAEKKIKQQKNLREDVEHELEKFRQYCAAQEKEIEVLRNTLNQHGIRIDDDYVAEKPKIALTQLSVVAEVNENGGGGGGLEATEDMDIKQLGEKEREVMGDGEGVRLTSENNVNTVQVEYHTNGETMA